MTPSGAPTLRERQKGLTRNAILEALAETITTQGFHAFSVQDVADRASVSHRTVYRHFPDREALLEGLAEKLDQVFRERDLPLLPESDADVVSEVRNAFEVFAGQPRLVRAVAIGALSTGSQPDSRRARDRAIRQRVEAAGRGLPEAETRRASAVVRYLANSLAWVVLTEQLGLDEDDATAAVVWAVETLLGDIRRRCSAVPAGREDPSEPAS